LRLVSAYRDASEKGASRERALLRCSGKRLPPTCAERMTNRADASRPVCLRYLNVTLRPAGLGGPATARIGSWGDDRPRSAGPRGPLVPRCRDLRPVRPSPVRPSPVRPSPVRPSPVRPSPVRPRACGLRPVASRPSVALGPVRAARRQAPRGSIRSPRAAGYRQSETRRKSSGAPAAGPPSRRNRRETRPKPGHGKQEVFLTHTEVAGRFELPRGTSRITEL